MTYKKIIEKLDNLMLLGEDKAKDFFYALCEDYNTYKKLSKNEIIDLFTISNFANKYPEFIIECMCNDTFYDAIDDESEKTIFLDLVYSKSRSHPFVDENFDYLMNRHASRNFFIDNRYAMTINDCRNYLSSNALINVLTSNSIQSINRGNFKIILKNLDFQPGEEVKQAMTLLNSVNFLNTASTLEIKEIIERLTFNLKTNREKKSFINKVLKSKNLLNKYLVKEKKLIDFDYIANGVRYNINDKLIEGEFYKNIYPITKNYEFKEFVKQFKEIDPMFFNYFNIECINSHTLKLDKGLLYGLIKSDYQNKLIRITNSSSATIFVKCANYLNKNYPNFNVAKLIDNLLEHPLKKEFIDSISDIDIPKASHYILNSIYWDLDNINRYEKRLIAYLDATYNVDCDMSDFKDALTLNRYGFTYEDLKNNIYYRYKQGINKLKDKRLIEDFKEFKDIILSNDKEYLFNKYQTNKFSFQDSLNYDDRVKNLYNKDLLNHVLKLKDLKYNYIINHNGQSICVKKIDTSFNALISAVGFNRQLEIINDNYKDSFVYHTNYLNHTISASFYSDTCLKRANGIFVLGYGDMASNSIQAMGPVDIFSNSDTYSGKSDVRSKFIHYSDLANYTRGRYNELVLERKNINKEDEHYLTNIYPSYVLTDTLDFHLDETIKASDDLDIPIVYIDRNKIIKNNEKKLNLELKKFDGTKVSDFINIANMIFNRESNIVNSMVESSEISIMMDKFLANNNSLEDYLFLEDFLLNEICKGSSNHYYQIYDEIVKLRKHINIDYSFIKFNINEESDLIKKSLDKFVNKGYIAKGYNNLPYKHALAISNIAIFLAKKCGFENHEELIKTCFIVSGNISDYIYGDYVGKSIYQSFNGIRLARSINEYSIENQLTSSHFYDIDYHGPLDEPFRTLSSIISASLDIYRGNRLFELSKKYDIDFNEIKEIHDKCNQISINETKKVARR